jgi:hypothetical protein
LKAEFHASLAISTQTCVVVAAGAEFEIRRRPEQNKAAIMPLMCQCHGDCGYELCCRRPGKRRKQAGHYEPLCDPCRGGTGKDRSRRPLKRPAAAVAAAGADAGTGSGLGADTATLTVLERIARALERLAAAPAAAVSATIPEAVLERAIAVPAPLQPLLVAAQAAAGQVGGAATVVAALGFHDSKKGLLFAALNAVLAVAAPQIALPGLVMTRPRPDSPDAVRVHRFCSEHMSLCMQCVMQSVLLPTVMQSVARGLRANPELRRRHGDRFLGEVAVLVSRCPRS